METYLLKHKINMNIHLRTKAMQAQIKTNNIKRATNKHEYTFKNKNNV